MTDQDLIDKVAELWDREGGDVDGFWMSVRRIADAIDEIQDRPTAAEIREKYNREKANG
jgi:hypothetical protein